MQFKTAKEQVKAKLGNRNIYIYIFPRYLQIYKSLRGPPQTSSSISRNGIAPPYTVCPQASCFLQEVRRIFRISAFLPIRSSWINIHCHAADAHPCFNISKSMKTNISKSFKYRWCLHNLLELFLFEAKPHRST